MQTQAKVHGLARKTTRRSQRNSSILSRLLTLHDLWSERRRLARLEKHRLDDLGISLEDAREEARRTFWDAPDRWRR